MKTPVITVIGSINMDMVTTTDVVPTQGETVIGKKFKTVPGGKGANQAVAAARLGATVHMVGRIGDDPFGAILRKRLEDEGVNVTGIEPVHQCSSGVATIIVSNEDNRIIVTPGANDEVTPNYVKKFKGVILSSDIILLQFEIPMETIEFVLELCEQEKVTVILNPAPARKMNIAYWRKAQIITPNKTEYNALFSRETAGNLLEKLIVTEGKNGASYYKNKEWETVSGFQVKPIDTTGAGDTFNGSLAVAVANGSTLEEAIQFANAAAALSIQSFGAQGGMPTTDQLKSFIDKHTAKD
ncbi:ribokinase [Bacillus shivajii]|uniref:ribokinase n=1 Tax=Bacillus shivajii TaxID=1983719 RepID=UPI001CFAC5C2|nr:ribokinase [Bacillus shivajii]UCZ53889.1 ribokinase [Bacillus shivajii]